MCQLYLHSHLKISLRIKETRETLRVLPRKRAYGPSISRCSRQAELAATNHVMTMGGLSADNDFFYSESYELRLH